jgi:glycosyltransferase involved in cell wall biosynthesis
MKLRNLIYERGGMNKAGTISIAMCTYNGERYLKNMLDSIGAQTVLPDELVICDDVSSDGTLKILEAYKCTSGFPVRIIKNSQNIGFVKNFEKVITNCTGDIILLADQDDYWQPYKVHEINRVFHDNPSCGYVFSNAELVDENRKSLSLDLWKSVGFNHRRYKQYTEGNQVEVLLGGGNFIYGTTMAFRAVFKSKLLPIDLQLSGFSHDTWICLILSALGAHGIAIQLSLVEYRQHAQQLYGVGKAVTFSGFVKSILSDKSEDYLVLADALQRIIERLSHEGQKGVHTIHQIKQLSDKVMHLRVRSLVETARGFQKWKIVIREAISGRYGQFSGGCKSILRDLIVSSMNR